MAEKFVAYLATPKERAKFVADMMQRTWRTEELMSFWACVNFSPGACARAVFPDKHKGYVRATRDLANYASNLAARETCRDRGDKNGVKVYQHAMDLCEDGFIFFTRPPKFRK
jgi:hypothetical protein